MDGTTLHAAPPLKLRSSFFSADSTPWKLTYARFQVSPSCIKDRCKSNYGSLLTSTRNNPRAYKTRDGCGVQSPGADFQRRTILYLTSTLLGAMFYKSFTDEEATASEFTDMPALRGKDYGKPKMRYPDYLETESGLQYKDLRVGTGSIPKEGETVVVDWDGYTIGYYGRIFEARNKAKGGSFEGNEKDFLKIKLGTHEVIPAFEEAIATMNVGGVRRIIVPPELGYPDNDFNKKGPRPTTFSGQRALDFVLKNQGLIDKTLLFDIELLKISPS